MNQGYFLFLLGYFFLVLLVGLVFSRRIQNLEDFFLAGRNLPASLVYLSLAASWIGASSTLVATDEAFAQGVSSFWIMGLPAVLTVLVFAFFLAGPIRRLPTVSLPDLVEIRYGRVVRNLAAVLIVWYMALLAASQMVALGNFLKLFTGTSYMTSLLLGTGVVLAYSVFGGFFSVVVTDGLQFLFLAAGMLGLLIFLSGETSLQEVFVQASQLGKKGYFDFFFGLKKNFLILLSFTLAWIISPIVWQRVQAARTEKKAQSGLLAASGTFVVYYWSVVLIGMLSLPLFLANGTGGPLLSELISSKTGLFLGGIVFVAVVAAIMSTMDTAINTGALSLAHDIFPQIFSSDKKKNVVLAGRLSTIALGAVAFLVATRLQDILKTLGLASEIMTEGLFIPGIAMIFWRKKIPAAGLLSLLLGGGYSVAGFLCEIQVLPLAWPAWPFSVPYGLALSGTGFGIGVLFHYFKERKLKARKL